jgi:XTP/dITP diphosphohydrolase
VRLFFGSSNAGKLRELRRLVEGLAVAVVSPADLARPLPEVVEDGATFRENAEKKAVAFARFAGMAALADDSGLCVDALGGAPGVHSARWSEDVAPALAREDRDRANNEKLLAALAGVPEDRRGAAYLAVLSVALPDGTVVASVEGSCRGRIGRAPRGAGGFGYDPLFIPAGELFPPPGGRALTMAELPPGEKDALSHRGEAFRSLRPILSRLAGLDEGRENR